MNTKLISVGLTTDARIQEYNDATTSRQSSTGQAD
jgi:hypothetical protein